MSIVTLSAQTQTVDLQPKNEAPIAPLPASRFSFDQIKKTGVWAWETSIQGLKAAPGLLQNSIKRVAASVYEFFATKLQATKTFIVNIPENISLKLGARAYAPRIAALEAQLAQERANRQAAPVAAHAPLPQIQEEPVMPIFPAHDEANAPLEAAPMLRAEEPASAATQTAPNKEPEKPMGALSFLFFWNYKK